MGYRKIYWSMVLVGWGCLHAQDSVPEQISLHAARANAAIQQKEFAKAEEEWRTVVALDPNSPQALHNLGLAYYLEHKYSKAEEALAKAVHLDASLVNARVLLGASLAREGKSDRAIVELDRALQSRLSAAAEKTARVALHEALFAREQYARALAVLSPLAETQPKDVDILFSLGQTYLQLAEQSFQRISSVDPNSYRVHQLLGDSFAKEGKYQDAIREYRKALEQRPDLPGVHYQIGLLYRTHDTSESGDSVARQEFEAELRINPYDAQSEYRLGRISTKWRDMNGALDHFRRAIELDPSYVGPRLGLARMMESEGNVEAAQQQLEMVTQLEPGNATAHYRLAHLYTQRGRDAAAEEQLKIFKSIQTGGKPSREELNLIGKQADPEPESPDESDY